MTSRRRVFPLIFLFILVGALIIFFLVRRGRGAEAAAYGEAVVICPGPDNYGYTCDSAGGYSYIDATHDTFLYLDDGTITIELPFAFTFYGTAYTEVTASSNGNLQFANANSAYFNECMAVLNENAGEDEPTYLGPAIGMGDMIAPYWDDLDLRFYGYLETEVVGEEPERIFVIEWDAIPPFGSDDTDTVTFEVQLFEGSSDIVFLYEDVEAFEARNGSSATVGLQSEAQELAIQFSCYQAAIANFSGIYLPHPLEPNPEIGLDDNAAYLAAAAIPRTQKLADKGDVVTLLNRLNVSGPTALNELRSQWLSQQPPLFGDWQWADLDGDGQDELILLWQKQSGQFVHSQLLIITYENDQMAVAYQQDLTNRTTQFGRLEFMAMADLTGDDQPELLWHDDSEGQSVALTAAANQWFVQLLPERCLGDVGLIDSNNDNLPDIVRNGCELPGRLSYTWQDNQFVKLAAGR